MQVKTVFRESDVLTPEMREQMDRFYRKIDEDLAWDEFIERKCALAHRSLIAAAKPLAF